MHSLFVTTTIFLSLVSWASNVIAATTPGCGKAPTIKPNINSTITVGSKARQYILRLPDNYDNKRPYRLVFTFHWMSGTATQVATGGGGTEPYYGLPALANDSTIFVSPNGQPENSGTRFAGLMGWKNEGGEDIQFVDALLKALQDDLCINTDLIFSTGFSYGGAISYALACARPNVYRAVGILSGGTMSGCEGGSAKKPIAYYEQHGTNDHVLPIAGARTIRDGMIKNNGCKPVSPEPKPPAGGHTKVVYEGCDPKYPLTWTVFDGDHTPVFKDTGAATSFSPEYVWTFFSQFK